MRLSLTIRPCLTLVQLQRDVGMGQMRRSLLLLPRSPLHLRLRGWRLVLRLWLRVLRLLGVVGLWRTLMRLLQVVLLRLVVRLVLMLVMLLMVGVWCGGIWEWEGVLKR